MGVAKGNNGTEFQRIMSTLDQSIGKRRNTRYLE